VRRALVLLSCNGAILARSFSGARPFLKTVLQGGNVPSARTLPDIPPSPRLRNVGGCGSFAE
jgi:hypothetical protein